MIVSTTKGPMEEDQLVKKTGNINNDNENTDWIEYWLDGELVHRSVHVRLKKITGLFGEAADLG